MPLVPERLAALRTLVAAYQATLPDAPLVVTLDAHHVSPLVLQQTLKLLRALHTHATRHQLVRQPPVPQALQAIRALLEHATTHPHA